LFGKFLSVLCVAALVSAPLPARAQQTELDALASRLAKQIGQSQNKKVVVLDFEGPDEIFLPLAELSQ